MNNTQKNTFPNIVDLKEMLGTSYTAPSDGYLYVGNNPNISGVCYVNDASGNRVGAIGTPSSHAVAFIKRGMNMIVYDYGASSTPTIAQFRY